MGKLKLRQFNGSFIKALRDFNGTFKACDQFEIIPITVVECKKIYGLLGIGGYVKINQ